MPVPIELSNIIREPAVKMPEFSMRPSELEMLIQPLRIKKIKHTRPQNSHHKTQHKTEHKRKLNSLKLSMVLFQLNLKSSNKHKINRDEQNNKNRGFLFGHLPLS